MGCCNASIIATSVSVPPFCCPLSGSFDSLPKNLGKIRSEWAVTSAIHDWVINPIWQKGFSEVHRGLFRSVANQARTIEGCDELSAEYAALTARESILTPSINDTSGFSTLWAFLSASHEDIGRQHYEKISNFVQNTRDIDVCEVQALESMAAELDLDNTRFIKYNFPKEIKKLIDLFSVKKNHFLNPEVLLLFNSLEWLDDNFLSDHASGKMGGYDFDVISGEYFCNLDLSANLAAQGLSGEELTETVNKFGIGDEWNKENVANLSTDDPSGTYSNISDDDFINIMERSISGQIMEIILTCDSEHGLLLDRIKIQGLETPDDSTSIENLKQELGVRESFSAKTEADNVLAQTTKIDDYPQLEQQVIQAEFDERAEQKNTSYLSKFLYEREKKVREYISLIEDINIYSSDIEEGTLLCLENIQINSFFDVYPDDHVLSGTAVSGDMITNTVHLLRNTCLQISYGRDYLKQVAQKHAIIGTASVITNIIKEHLYRQFSPSSLWRYHSFEDPINPVLSAKFVIDGLDPSISNVKVIEYLDTTEYMNISAHTDLAISADLVNDRYWEGDLLDNAITQSEHTQADILEFYQNAGFGENATFEDVSTTLSRIYDMGAVPQTNYANYETAPEPTASGTFGTFGQWTWDTNTQTGCISADVEPIFEYLNNIWTSGWVASPLISSVPIDDFRELWTVVPVVSTWQNDPEVSATSFLTPDYVQAYIDEAYAVSAWTENTATTRWRLSPLIAAWSIPLFSEEWDISYKEQNNDDQLAIDNVWRAYETLTSNRYGWQQNGFFKQAVDTPVSAGGFGGFPSEPQWLASDFITPFVGTPFTSAVVSNTFKTEDDWQDVPFVATWNDDPFTLTFTNEDEIETCYSTRATMLEALVEVSGIPPLDGQLNDPSYFTGDSLSSVFFKYNGLSGENIAANKKNQVHPSWAVTPFIWNLKEILDQTVKCFNDLPSNPLKTKAKYEEEIVTRINECGSTIQSWRKGYDEFTGYITEFENSSNIDADENENRYIDRDGPWIWEALSALIIDPTAFRDDFISDTSEFYKHLSLSDDDQDKIATQLEFYTSEIYELSGMVIAQFATDQFGNQYTLFKEDRNFDTPGKIWMRIKNHPISFPLIGYDPLSGRFDPCNVITDYNLSQIDTTLQKMRELPFVANKCYNFDFLPNRMFIGFGGDCPSTEDKCIPQATSGFISVADFKFREFELENDVVKFTAVKDQDIIFEGWEVDENEKFIGWYGTDTDVVAAVVRKDNLMANFESEISGELLLSGITFSEYLSGVNSPSYLTPISGITEWNGLDTSMLTMYSGNIKYSTYNKRSKTKSSLSTFLNVYDELTFPYCDSRYHNQWKLGHSTDLVTHAYEFATVSAMFHNYQTEDCNGKFDNAVNSNCGLRKNGITTISQQTTDETPEGHNDPFIDNFYKYTRVSYLGLNACGKIGVAQNDYYTVSLSTSPEFTIQASSGILINDDLYDVISGCVDREATMAQDPIFGFIDLSADGGFTYTLAASSEEYSLFDFRNWKRTAHGTYHELSGLTDEYPECITPGNDQFIFSAPSAVTSIPSIHPLSNISFLESAKEFLTVKRMPYFVALHSDKYKENWMINTIVDSTAEGRGGIGILLASHEDFDDLVVDPITFEIHPRMHTLSVLRYLGGRVDSSCSFADCAAHLNGNVFDIDGNTTWAIVYNRMQIDERVVATITPETIGDNCEDFMLAGGWPELSAGVMLEAYRKCNDIRVRMTPADKLPLRTNLEYELKLDLRSDPDLLKFQGEKPYGFVVHNQDFVTWGAVQQDVVYDRFAYIIDDVELDMNCGMAFVDLEMDISGACLELTVNKVSENNNDNILTEDVDENKILENNEFGDCAVPTTTLAPVTTLPPGLCPSGFPYTFDILFCETTEITTPGPTTTLAPTTLAPTTTLTPTTTVAPPFFESLFFTNVATSADPINVNMTIVSGDNPDWDWGDGNVDLNILTPPEHIYNDGLSAHIVEVSTVNPSAIFSLDLEESRLSDIDVSNLVNMEILNLGQNLELTSISGMPHLASLTQLTVANSSLNTLDVSNNGNLSILTVPDNNLTSLDVTNNLSLGLLSVARNNLSTLDITNNLGLVFVDAQDNNLSVLDISNNDALQILSVKNNNITTLDLADKTSMVNLLYSGNPIPTADFTDLSALKTLEAQDCTINSIDVTPCTLLTSIRIDNNNLSTIDTTGLTDLTAIYAGQNSITSMDFTDNVNLGTVNLSNNNLTTLDLSTTPTVNVIELATNSLNQAAVDNVLSTLVSHGVSNGSLAIQGNTAPSASGLTDVATLQGLGWTVTHD